MERTNKGTWEDGDLEIKMIVYKGKRVTLEELKKIKEEEKENHHG